MTKKNQPDLGPDTRRLKVESDVAKFLNSGAKILQIPNGVTAYDGQGRTKSALTPSRKQAAAPSSQAESGSQAPKTTASS